MKKRGIALLITLIFVFSACEDQQLPLECDGDLLCTENFVTLTFAPKDANNQAVILDSYYSQNLDNGNTYSFNNSPIAGSEGVYAVLSDAQMGEVQKTGTVIRFFGERDGQIVIEQDFTIGHDCCHIELISGPGSQN